MAETKTPQEITTAIEQAFSDRDGLASALFCLLEKLGYASDKEDLDPQLLASRAYFAGVDMSDVCAALKASGYDVGLCRLSSIVSELLARTAASTLRPAVSSGPDPSEQLAGSLFAMLSHLGYEPEGEATPDELARLVDVAMEETASYKRLESEVRALADALERERGQWGELVKIAREAGLDPSLGIKYLFSVAVGDGASAGPVRLTREYDITTRQSDGMPGVQIGSSPVGAAIHDEERIRQIVREEVDSMEPLYEERAEWEKRTREIAREELGEMLLENLRASIEAAEARRRSGSN